jgi:hypothetical protein
MIRHPHFLPKTKKHTHRRSRPNSDTRSELRNRTVAASPSFAETVESKAAVRVEKSGQIKMQSCQCQIKAVMDGFYLALFLTFPCCFDVLLIVTSLVHYHRSKGITGYCFFRNRISKMFVLNRLALLGKRITGPLLYAPVRTMNTATDYFIKRMLHQLGEREFDKFELTVSQSKLLSVTPTANMFSALMHYHALRGRADLAMPLLKEMKQAAVAPTAMHFRYLMLALLNSGTRVSEAEAVFDEMLQCGLAPGLEEYHVLLRCFVADKRPLAVGLGLAVRLDAAGISPSRLFMNTLLELAANHADAAVALRLWDDMCRSVPTGVGVDVFTVSHVLSALRNTRALRFPVVCLMWSVLMFVIGIEAGGKDWGVDALRVWKQATAMGLPLTNGVLGGTPWSSRYSPWFVL